MPRLTKQLPKYRLHASGQAVVRIHGRDLYLGTHNSKESRRKYDRLMAEYLAAGRALPAASGSAGERPSGHGLTINEVVERFLDHVERYYRRPDGTPTSEPANMKQALRPLVTLFGDLPIKAFGPLRIKAVRQHMTANLGWCRTNTNRAIARLKTFFKWAASEELVPPSVYQGLQAVQALALGRTDARESEQVRPVPDDVVEATLVHLPATVAAMVRLQRLTGMRPGEVCDMRVGHVDCSEEIWIYRPPIHKTVHHGHRREVYLGPQAQAIIEPRLDQDADRHLFRPDEAERQRRAKVHKARRTPMSCGNRPGTNRKRRPRRVPGSHYDVDAYRRAIARACDHAYPCPEQAVLSKRAAELRKLGIGVARARRQAEQELPEAVRLVRAWRRSHRWHPHQLRHTAATAIAREFGIEKARVILGHQHTKMTELYAERDRGQAAGVMRQVG